MKLVFLPLIFLYASQAFACYGAPQHLVVPYKNLVSRTSRIALAKVVEVHPLRKERPNHPKFASNMVKLPIYENWVTYVFEVREVIKGDFEKTFEIDSKEVPEISDSTFDDHTDCSFWQDGRSGNSGDCQLYPLFNLGSEYLVFLDPPYHWKSFERIAHSKTDAWMAAVKAAVSGESKQFECEAPAKPVVASSVSKKIPSLPKSINRKPIKFLPRDRIAEYERCISTDGNSFVLIEGGPGKKEFTALLRAKGQLDAKYSVSRSTLGEWRYQGKDFMLKVYIHKISNDKGQLGKLVITKNEKSESKDIYCSSSFPKFIGEEGVEFPSKPALLKK